MGIGSLILGLGAVIVGESVLRPRSVPMALLAVALGSVLFRAMIALALQLGYWCGRVLPPEGPILLGMDSRSSGPMLVAALAAGLTAAGREARGAEGRDAIFRLPSSISSLPPEISSQTVLSPRRSSRD